MAATRLYHQTKPGASYVPINSQCSNLTRYAMLDALQREGLGSHHSAFGSMRGSGSRWNFRAVKLFCLSNMIKLSVNETEWCSQNPRSYPLYFDLKI